MRGRGRVAVSGVQSGVVMTSPHSGGGRGAAGSDRRSVEPAAPRTVSTWGAGCGDRVRTTTKRLVAPAAWNRLSRHDLADAWRAALLALACVAADGALAWAGPPTLDKCQGGRFKNADGPVCRHCVGRQKPPR